MTVAEQRSQLRGDTLDDCDRSTFTAERRYAR